MAGHGRAALIKARFAAVQALYNMDIGRAGLEEVIHTFSSASGQKLPGGQAKPRQAFGHFEDVMRGVVREQKSIDQKISAHLDSKWKLARIDSVMRAILRAAAYELLYRADVPRKSVIDEYVRLAHDFALAGETGMINAVLDKIARENRP